MTLSQQLAVERRRRLEAERLLKLREGELRSANARLAKHSMSLTEELDETRSETEAVRGVARDLQATVTTARTDLARATKAADEAERRLWAALQTMRDGFALFDADGRLAVANNAYLSVFDGLDEVRPGIAFDRMTRLLIEEGIVDPQGPPDAWLHRVGQRLEQEPIPDLTIRLWSGEFIKLVDRRMPDGGIVSLAIDQTEMMRIWAAIETVPDGFVMFDQDDRLIMCNQRYRELLPDGDRILSPGASFEDILRFGIARGHFALAVDREEAWLDERMNARRGREVTLREEPLSDGRWMRVLEGPTPDGGRVGLQVDITALKEHQAELERERERAEAANRAKSAFLANMSHEIRTPMNGVVGMADLLRDTRLEEDQALYAETIKTSGEALLDLLNDILDYSKIEAGRITLHEAPFDLETCLHESLLLMQPQAREKSLGLMVDFDIFLPVDFVGDRGRIRQVLNNLIGNAVKFTPEGHVLVRVTGHADDAEPDLYQVHITVEDTGIGIAPDKLDHVFGKFNQVEEDRNRSFEGSGLGLAITRELVEAMGGRIWVDSSPGAGSCFGLAVPLHAAPGSAAAWPRVCTPVRAVVVAPETEGRAVLLRQLQALEVEAEAHDIAAIPRLSGGIAFMAESGDRATTEANVSALRAAGMAKVCLVTGCNAPSDVSAQPPPPEGVDAVLAHPIRRARLAELLFGPVQEPATPSPPAPTAPSPASGDAIRLRVLAAEDNRTNRLVFERLIADQDVDLTIAENGAEAVALFTDASGPPDMIFMDISMPEMDGKEATARIREIEAERGWKSTPIVAMTAHALTGDAEEILAAGLDDYLTKPMRKAQVVTRLDAVRAKRLNDAAPPATGVRVAE